VKVRVLNVQLRLFPVRARMPFRYGMVTMTRAPHLMVEAQVEVDGKVVRGVSADHLPPKWFTKNPDTTPRQDVAQMLVVIEHAAKAAVVLGGVDAVFHWWRELYTLQATWAAGWKIPPLLANFGVSLLERAVIDAFCRATGTTFARAVRDNTLGMHLGVLDAAVTGEPAALLPAVPLEKIVVRHTVGLSDPLTDREIPPEELAADGLPQSLEACVAAQRLTHFKIKLGGVPEADAARLQAIARVIGGKIAFTLDGNENYQAVAPFRELWERLTADRKLGNFLRGLIVVEQPLHRDVALSEETAAELRTWSQRPPMIIDESDGELDSLPRALECGYIGTSHKNCKGVFKGLLNACRLRMRAAAGKRAELTAEDLSNIGPVALLQDLAVVATLGITHAERNGHHYFAGLREWPEAIQKEVLAGHADLYEMAAGGFPAVRVRNGKMSVRSAVSAPFGYAGPLELSGFMRVEDWDGNV